MFFTINSYSCLFLLICQVSAEENVLIPEKRDLTPIKIIHDILDDAKIERSSDENPVRDCNITSQFKLHENKLWSLESLDRFGNPKKVGGDELYVTFHSKDNKNVHPTAVAKVRDHKDGKYTLHFVSTPMHPELFYEMDLNSGGTMTLYYSYTCGMADIAAPKKNSWKTGGFVNRVYEVEVVKSPEIIEFTPPTLPKQIKPFDHVIGIGDSMMMQLSGSLSPRSNGSFTNRLSSPLNSETADLYLHKIVTDLYSEKVQEKVADKNSVLVLIGSGIWDETEDNSRYYENQTHYKLDQQFSDHRVGIDMLMEGLATEFKDDDKFQFAWKSTTATHSHRIPNDDPETLHRTKYTTLARSKRLYMIQKALMEKHQMPFLDIYEASYLSADYHKDTSHFIRSFNTLLWNWFFPEHENTLTAQS